MTSLHTDLVQDVIGPCVFKKCPGTRPRKNLLSTKHCEIFITQIRAISLPERGRIYQISKNYKKNCDSIRSWLMAIRLDWYQLPCWVLYCVRLLWNDWVYQRSIKNCCGMRNLWYNRMLNNLILHKVYTHGMCMWYLSRICVGKLRMFKWNFKIIAIYFPF